MIRGGKEWLQNPPMKAKRLTDFARDLCEKWIGILSLNEWVIGISFIRPEQMPRRIIARIVPNYHGLAAKIQINAHIDSKKLEETICHELLHLRLGRVSYQLQMKGLPDRITNQEIAEIKEQEERAVTVLARSFERYKKLLEEENVKRSMESQKETTA